MNHIEHSAPKLRLPHSYDILAKYCGEFVLFFKAAGKSRLQEGLYTV